MATPNDVARQIAARVKTRRLELDLTQEGLCAFEYSTDWLSSRFSISPFELPLQCS